MAKTINKTAITPDVIVSMYVIYPDLMKRGASPAALIKMPDVLLLWKTYV